MRKRLASSTLLLLTALALVVPSAPAAADTVCAYNGDGWEKIEACAEWSGGHCVHAWAMSGPRYFHIWDTCP